MDASSRRSRRTPPDGRDAPEQPSFGGLLRRYRVARGLTQEALAARSTVSLRAISDIERGVKRKPQRETMRLLAEALELSEAERAPLEAAARPQVARPAVAPVLPMDNLFAPVTPLLGREGERSAVVALLRRDDVRLVTITGCGGVGKTRLGVAVGAALRGDFPSGVIFVSLAMIRDPDQVAAAIAGTLGLKERPGESPRDHLKIFLRDRPLLLVFDNFEHLTAEVLLVSELLAACPSLKILVTSRESLHLRGEYTFALAPLSLPDAETWNDAIALGRSPAIAIFCQRAQAAAYDFALTDENAPVVAAICARLDGLPLAIELAAARIPFFRPEMLLERLDARLPELTNGPRDSPARQRTMRGAIDWSYRALDEAERALFARLAVFIGGCTLEAAAAVCATGGDGAAVLDGVMSLVGKNLLLRAEGAEPRVVMLETIREYGVEMLSAHGEMANARRRHATYFLTFAEGAEPELTGPRQAAWSAKLLADHDNLRAALRWALEERDVQTGLRLAAALWRFWEARGYLREAREWLARMLALPLDTAGAPSLIAVRARALNGASMLAYRHGDYAEAVCLSEECLALSPQREGEGAAHSEALGNLGFIAYRRGDNARAATLIRESLALARKTGDTLSIATALNRLGIVESHRGNADTALECYAECLALHRQRGHRRNIGNALDNLGCAMRRAGEYGSADSLSGESLALFRALGDDWGIANALLNLADTRRDQGDEVGAVPGYVESLRLYRRVGNMLGMIECLEGIGRACHTADDAYTAARLLGAAVALRETIGTPLPSVEWPAHERAVAAIRSALGVMACDKAWSAGAALSVEQTIAEAMERANKLMLARVALRG